MAIFTFTQYTKATGQTVSFDVEAKELNFAAYCSALRIIMEEKAIDIPDCTIRSYAKPRTTATSISQNDDYYITTLAVK